MNHVCTARGGNKPTFNNCSARKDIYLSYKNNNFLHDIITNDIKDFDNKGFLLACKRVHLEM